MVFCVETKAIYECAYYAENTLGIKNVYRACDPNSGRHTAGGYHWLYVYDQTKRDGTIIQGAISLGYITEKEIENVENFSI